MTTSQRIINARKSKGMTQEELAAKVGISRHSMSRIECSDALNMNAYTAVRIARALGLSLDFLLCGNC